MSEIQDGGCHCGAVRYRLTEKPLALACCHCTGCQRQSGSAFGMSMAVMERSFQLTSGTLKVFAVPCDSGRTKSCFFCGDCGTRIYNKVHDGVLSLKAGTLDDTSALEPSAHYWMKHKQKWVVIPPGHKCFEDDA